eukprot:660091-Rhodomonas_salina.1
MASTSQPARWSANATGMYAPSYTRLVVCGTVMRRKAPSLRFGRAAIRDPMYCFSPAAVRAVSALAVCRMFRQSAAPGQMKSIRSPGSPHAMDPSVSTIRASNATPVVHRAFAQSAADVSKSSIFIPVRVARDSVSAWLGYRLGRSTVTVWLPISTVTLFPWIRCVRVFRGISKSIQGVDSPAGVRAWWTQRRICIMIDGRDHFADSKPRIQFAMSPPIMQMVTSSSSMSTPHRRVLCLPSPKWITSDPSSHAIAWSSRMMVVSKPNVLMPAPWMYVLIETHTTCSPLKRISCSIRVHSCSMGCSFSDPRKCPRSVVHGDRRRPRLRQRLRCGHVDLLTPLLLPLPADVVHLFKGVVQRGDVQWFPFLCVLIPHRRFAAVPIPLGQLHQSRERVGEACHIDLTVVVGKGVRGFPPVAWPPLPVHHERVCRVPQSDFALRDPAVVDVDQDCITPRDVDDLRVCEFAHAGRVHGSRLHNRPDQAP